MRSGDVYKRQVLEAAELHAVGRADGLERHAPRRMDAVAGIVAIRAAGLQVQAASRGRLAHALGERVLVGLRQRHELRHVRLELFVHFHEAEDAAVHVRRKLRRHGLERLQVPLHRVRFGEQDRVVAPCDAPLPHLGGQPLQRVDGLFDGRDAGLHVLSVGRDGVVEAGVEAVGDLVQARQNGRVVRRAEHHAVHHLSLIHILALYADV